eukprot:12362970-Alexandrium_andersonii.AAC.1
MDLDAEQALELAGAGSWAAPNAKQLTPGAGLCKLSVPFKRFSRWPTCLEQFKAASNHLRLLKTVEH